MPNSLRTKAQILEARKEEAKKNYEILCQEITDLMNSNCTKSNGEPIKCSHCGTQFITEWDFASHYLIPNETLLNIGYCSIKPAIPSLNPDF